MTSIGRGRGRGWVQPAAEECALRRPGQPASPKTFELDEFVDKIFDEVSIDEPTPQDLLRNLGSLADSIANDIGEQMLVGKLWDQALEDRCFGIKLLKLYRTNNEPGIKQSDFLFRLRVELLRRMQEYYDRRDELLMDNPSHLANLVWYLGVVVENNGPIGTACKIQIKPLMALALVNCLKLLLENATEEYTEIVAIQICLNGRNILTASTFNCHVSPKLDIPTDKELNSVVNNARTILVNRNVSARTRALLLLIVDLGNRGFEPLTGDLQMFYASILGDRLQDTDANHCIGREFNSKSYLYEILTREMKSSKNDDNFVKTEIVKSTNNELPLMQTQKMNLGPSVGASGPTPRAIRGSGASETAKDHRNEKKISHGHKDKLTDQQVWSAKQNTGSKVWGHDDRFDNDYE